MDRLGGGRRAAAWAAGGVSCVAGVATAILAVLNHASIHSLGDVDLAETVISVSFSAAGVLLATRRPRNPLGWLFLLIALDAGLSGVALQYARFAELTSPGSAGGADWAQWFYAWSSRLSYPAGAAALGLLLLPDGRFASPRWRWVAWACALVTPVTALLAAANPYPLSTTPSELPALTNPLGVGAPGVLVSTMGAPMIVSGVVALLLSLIAAASPIVRLVRARGETRMQLKWIAFAVASAMAVTTCLFVVAGAVPSVRDVALSLTTVSIVLGFGVAFPVAVGVAILRHRLYDIDLVISRTLVYGALAAFITAAYVVIVVGVGSLAGTGGSPNTGLSLLATTIVAGGFQPLRVRLQRAANRLVYGSRATPYEVLSRFSQRVAETYAVDEVLPAMAHVLAEGTGAQRADVWLHAGGVLRPAASWPETAAAGAPVRITSARVLPPLAGADRAVAVRHRGDLLGALSIGKRAGDEVTPMEEKLLADLAHQAGLVLRNVRLTGELLDRIDELRASRQRLVTAQDEERRRLERDLHDGAQQHLVALRLKLGMAETLVRREPEAALRTFDELRSDADDALDALRELSHGIYPPLLALRGLAAALEAHARRSAIPVDVVAEGVGRYAEPVEACVYFCCLEALQNVQKHAHARRAEVRLGEERGVLRFEVIDDGCGFDVDNVDAGIGLRSVKDRLEAAGGRIAIRSQAGRGTMVRGEVPAAAVAAAPGADQRAPSARKRSAALTRR